jgi:hypothetical protein
MKDDLLEELFFWLTKEVYIIAVWAAIALNTLMNGKKLYKIF